MLFEIIPFISKSIYSSKFSTYMRNLNSVQYFEKISYFFMNIKRIRDILMKLLNYFINESQI